MYNAKFLTTTGAEIALASPRPEDDDQRHGEPVSSRAVPETEVPRLDAGEEMDEMNTHDRGSKRVRFAESRCQKRQHTRKEQRLDADVQVRSKKLTGYKMSQGMRQRQRQNSCRRRKESMNIFASSRTEVIEKIEESLRHSKGVDDLKDDEVAELCVHSKINPSRFVSHATTLGLHEVFAVDLTAAKSYWNNAEPQLGRRRN